MMDRKIIKAAVKKAIFTKYVNDRSNVRSIVARTILSKYAQTPQAPQAATQPPSQANDTGQVTPIAIGGGGNDQLFKRDLNWQESEEAYLTMSMMDLNPDKVFQRAEGVLTSLGYRPNTKYSPQQIQEFSQAVAQNLKGVFSGKLQSLLAE